MRITGKREREEYNVENTSNPQQQVLTVTQCTCVDSVLNRNVLIFETCFIICLSTRR